MQLCEMHGAGRLIRNVQHVIKLRFYEDVICIHSFPLPSKAYISEKVIATPNCFLKLENSDVSDVFPMSLLWKFKKIVICCPC